MSCGGNLFGPSSQFIKTNGGDLIATEGASTREKMILSDLRIPYKQIIKGRVILKPGQSNYPLNHLGLGDNATFLMLKVTYDHKSKFEFDNYIQWNFYDDFSNLHPISNLLVLTGNSKNRIKQIYLSNPNPNYSVSIDAMIAVIDDNTSIFVDTVNQTGLSFFNLKHTDIKTHIVNESIVIYSNDLIPVPICYISIDDLRNATITKNGKIITLSDISVGSIYLDFLNVYEAVQSYSIIEWVKNTPGAIIQDLSPLEDIVDPIITFTNLVYIDGTTYSSPYDTKMATTFSATMSFAQYATSSVITKLIVANTLISSIVDNRDNIISFDNNSILIYQGIDEKNEITQSGATYSVHFNVVDNAENYVDSVKNIQLYIE